MTCRLHYRIAGLTISLAVLAGPMIGQSVFTPVSRADLFARIPASDGELTPTVRALIRSADNTGGTRGQQLYRDAVKMARRERHLPSFSSWKLANRYFADGDTIRAAGVLDGLASEAAAQGDIGIEALAIYYSVWLNGKVRRAPEFTTRMAKLQQLLQSQYMPVAVRAEIDERLNGPAPIAQRP